MASSAPAYADTPQKIARIRDLWNEKTGDGRYAYSVRIVGEMVGTTKNVLVGWAHRTGQPKHGLEIRDAPTRKGKVADPNRPRPVARVRVETKTLPPLASLAPAAPTITIVTTRAPAPRPTAQMVADVPAPRIGKEDCAWLFGEATERPAEWRRCTNKAVQFRPYCGDCAKRAYVRVRDRREDAHAD